MKITYIINHIKGTSGLERIIALKANYFIDNFKYEVGILSLDNEKEATPFFEIDDAVKLLSPYDDGHDPKGFFDKMKSVNTILKNENPDVVIVCVDDIFGLYLPYFLKKKYHLFYERHNSQRVNYTHNPTSLKSKLANKFKKTLLRLGATRFDKVILLSNDHKEEWKQIKDKDIVVINNPLIFYPDSHAALENKKVLAVGRHKHQKGFDMLLQSWAEVVKTHKDWTLDIYGNGDENSSLLKQAETLGVTEYVNFYDPVPNIMDVYMEASIYVLSSRFEGFPLVLIETMACGVPAVAFNCPCGVKELITNNVEGLLVEINDTKAFANSINHLIENPDERKEMGRKSRENIKRLSPDVIFLEWKTFFESLEVKN